MKKTTLLFGIFLLSVLSLPAQNQFGLTAWDSIPVTISGTNLKNPWTGGLNTPMFSAIDLDGDGIKDLFVLDRDHDKMLTFLNKGTPNTVDYHYAPEFLSKFPALTNYALLVDYNGDGKEDIFAFTNAGMKVYRNDFTITDGLKFTLVCPLLYALYPGPTGMANIFTSPTNLPAFVDMDNDGDLDIVNLDGGGLQIEYFKNVSMENYGIPDSLRFEEQPGCWCHSFLSSSTNSAILGSSCRTSDPGLHNEPQDGFHSGFTFLVLDLDGDGDKEIVIGDIGFNNLLMLTNGGTATSANCTAQDPAFPSHNTSTLAVNLKSLPGAYFLDVDNDGLKDLLVAPSVPLSSENFKSVWFYKNSGTNTAPVFTFVQNDFLQGEMIEVGEGCNPAFFDVDADGKMDMIIGNYGYSDISNVMISGLSYYRNVGTVSAPAYDLITRDYAGVNSLGLLGIYPSFGDLDGDGDLDMLLGNADGTLVLYSNFAGPGNPVNFTMTNANYMGIDVGQNSAPQIIDLDSDGKVDLVVGRRNGTLSYFHNNSSTSVPNFLSTPTTANFGGVNVTPFGFVEGYASPWFYLSQNNTLKLLVASMDGFLLSYTNITGNLTGAFLLQDSTVIDRFEGGRLSVSGADINGDSKMDFIVGNYLGGCRVFRNDNFTGIANAGAASRNTLRFYPDPANESVYIRSGQDGIGSTIQLFSVDGRMILEKKNNSENTIIDTSELPSGFYFCRAVFENTVLTGKLIVSH